MWGAIPLSPEANFIFLSLFIPTWLTMMGSFVYFWWRIAPSALQRWADEEGFQIVSRKDAGFLDRLSCGACSSHRVYRITVRDKAGRSRAALVRVGAPFWFCMSLSTCPVEVRWTEMEPEPQAARQPPLTDRMWDRELD